MPVTPKMSPRKQLDYFRLFSGGIPIGFNGVPASESLSPKAPVQPTAPKPGWVPTPTPALQAPAPPSPATAEAVQPFAGALVGQAGTGVLGGIPAPQTGFLPQGAFESLNPVGEGTNPEPQMGMPTLSAMLSMGGFDPSTGASMAPPSEPVPTSLGLGGMPPMPSFQSQPVSPIAGMDPRILGWAQMLGTLGAGISAQDPQSWQYNLGRTVAGMAGQGLQEKQAAQDQANRQSQQVFDNAMAQRGLAGREKDSELSRQFDQQKYNQLLQQQAFENMMAVNRANQPVPLGNGYVNQGGELIQLPEQVTMRDMADMLEAKARAGYYDRGNQPEVGKPQVGYDPEAKQRVFVQWDPTQGRMVAVPGMVPPPPTASSGSNRPFIRNFKRPDGSWYAGLVDPFTGNVTEVPGEVARSLNSMDMWQQMMPGGFGGGLSEEDQSYIDSMLNKKRE